MYVTVPLAGVTRPRGRRNANVPVRFQVAEPGESAAESTDRTLRVRTTGKHGHFRYTAASGDAAHHRLAACGACVQSVYAGKASGLRIGIRIAVAPAGTARSRIAADTGETVVNRLAVARPPT